VVTRRDPVGDIVDVKQIHGGIGIVVLSGAGTGVDHIAHVGNEGDIALVVDNPVCLRGEHGQIVLRFILRVRDHDNLEISVNRRWMGCRQKRKAQDAEYEDNRLADLHSLSFGLHSEKCSLTVVIP
jgi:hypothetical protein